MKCIIIAKDMKKDMPKNMPKFGMFIKYLNVHQISEYKKYLNSLILVGATYKRTDAERQKVIDRLNLAKKNMPISKLAMKRWISEKYLENNPTIYKEFMKICITVDLTHI